MVNYLLFLDYESKTYWTIRDANYKPEKKEENFILHSESMIQDYTEKIDNLEIQIKNKEIATEDLRIQIENIKKQIFKTHGFIDDQTQTLDDVVRDMEMKNQKFKDSHNYDVKINEFKMKLKCIMERKNTKTMEFFCSNQVLFIKYFDTLTKILKSKLFYNLDNSKDDVAEYFDEKFMSKLKERYYIKLNDLKGKMDKLNKKEEQLEGDLFKFKHFEKPVDELFKQEIEQYKINEDSI
jgi:hypothetical protein